MYLHGVDTKENLLMLKAVATKDNEASGGVALGDINSLNVLDLNYKLAINDDGLTNNNLNEAQNNRVKQVQDVVNQITVTWANPPEIEIVYDFSDIEGNEHYRNKLDKLGSVPTGVFDNKMKMYNPVISCHILVKLLKACG